MTRREDAGHLGEDLAARYLQRHGYRVLHRNYRCRLGEIDLIVDGPEGLVFVEVRTKRRPCLFSPEETVTRAKALRVATVAEHYLASTGLAERPWRVDVVAVELSAEGDAVRVEQFRDVTSDVMAG